MVPSDVKVPLHNRINAEKKKLDMHIYLKEVGLLQGLQD